MRATGRVLLAATLLTSGCFLLKPHPPTPPTPPSGCSGFSTPQQTFLALYSIFGWVEATVHSGSPAWHVATLKQSTDWLLCDPDVNRKNGRIRYAVVRLAAGIVVMNREHLSPAMVADFQLQMNRLVGGPNSLVPTLSLVAGATTLSALEDVAGIIIDTSHEASFDDLKQTCCHCIDSCDVGTGDNEAIAEFVVNTNRNPQCLFHVIDPQCWPSVVPGYVNQTFVLGNAPPCKSGKPSCRSKKTCDATLSPPLQMTMPPQAGTPWCGLAFEDVHGDANDSSTRFKNILKVGTVYLFSPTPQTTPAVQQMGTPRPPAGFRADYGLCESPYWQVCDPGQSPGGSTPSPIGTPCPEGTCAVTKDCGFATVESTGQISTGWSALTGSKHIAFKSGLPHDMNLWAPLALEVMVKEIAIASCVPAGECPQAAMPNGCTIPSGSPQCLCAHDSCTQQPSPFAPSYPVPYCY